VAARTWTKEIDRSGLAVVLAEDGSAFLIFGTQVIINMPDGRNHFLPAKLIGENLWVAARMAMFQCAAVAGPIVRMYATSLPGGKIGTTSGASSAPAAMIRTSNPGWTSSIDWRKRAPQPLLPLQRASDTQCEIITFAVQNDELGEQDHIYDSKRHVAPPVARTEHPAQPSEP